MSRDKTRRPDDEEDSATELDQGIDRRKLLKTAGLGLVATAGAIAAGTPAMAQRVDESQLTLIDPGQPAVPVPLTRTEAVCGLTSDAPLKANQIEVVVPASRELIVRKIPDELLPMAEVTVKVSRQILAENKRQMFLAIPSPVIFVEP